VVVARAFQHEGPGRDERFAVGSWTAQLVRLRASGGGLLRVGELGARRDITDVRDVCRAYRLLLEPGVEPGVYNVARGSSVSMEEVLHLLVDVAGLAVEVEHDPARLRPAEIPVLCGDASKLTRATGWQPKIPLRRTLADALAEADRTTSERIAKA
jgi:GDP-4-dehydro-6-deoxy-D-mannose reductase